MADLSSFAAVASSFVLQLRASASSYLSRFEPLALVVLPLVTLAIARSVQSFIGGVYEKGVKDSFISFFMSFINLVPGVTSYIDAEKQKVGGLLLCFELIQCPNGCSFTDCYVVEQMESGSKSKRKEWRSDFPAFGFGIRVLEMMKEDKGNDVGLAGKMFGYIGGSESDGHFTLINEACFMFVHTNTTHLDVFRSVAYYEAEVVAMTVALLGSKEKSSGVQVCGNMTSGGTESILLAVKRSRYYMQATKGITSPDMIIPESVHSAYDKAAHYFNIKLGMFLLIKKTIVESAPGFPYGIIDPIEEIGELASRNKICLHVDLCLGGFVLPFSRKLGYPVPPFDFSVEGVTSISADVHKYGLATKGTSIVLYRNHDIRKHQFVSVTEWSGGLHISPSMAGSHPGGLIAGAWVAMMSLGLEGYKNNTRDIVEVSKKIEKGYCNEIPMLFVIGRPDMTIVAFGSNVLDIFEVNVIMLTKGWHLNALQRPNSIHICVTLQRGPVVVGFLTDLKESVDTVKKNPGSKNGGFTLPYMVLLGGCPIQAWFRIRW